MAVTSGALSVFPDGGAFSIFRDGGGGGIGPAATVFEDPHQYWRIIAQTGSGTNIVSMGEISMAATPGGADQCSGGTVIFGSQNNTTTEAAANAFDNNTATRWSSAAGGPYWVGYNFGSPVVVQELTLTYRSDGFASTRPVGLDLEWSDDGVTWTKHASFDDVAWTASQVKTYTMTAVGSDAHDYWRTMFFGFSNGTIANIAELEMAATAGGADECTGGTPFGGANPSASFDDDPATRSPFTGAARKVTGYQFAAPIELREFRFQVDATDPPLGVPTDLWWQYREVAGLWRTACAAPSQTGWTAGEMRSFANPYFE